MQDTLRTIAAFYASAAVWMSVLLTTALGWTLTMGGAYATLGLTPDSRSAMTMAVALTLATIAGGATWRVLGRRRSTRTAQRPLEALAEGTRA